MVSGEVVPDTLTGLPLVGVTVAVYLVMAAPLLFGAVKATTMLALPAVVDVIVGAPGAPSGSPLTAAEAGPVPTELVAVTVKL